MIKYIVNASPIISLCAINRIDILLKQTDELIIPNGVYEEIIAHNNINDNAVKWAGEYISKIRSAVQVDPRIAAWDLGKGESEVMSFCINNSNCLAVIDDLAARKCAATFNIKVKGTLALVISAKNKNLIPSVKPVFTDLKENGFRISEVLFLSLLRIAGE